jgi:CspA family cold shock protein
MSTDRKDGSIARLFPDRVFGFIRCPADARDYFFHQTQLEGCTFAQLEPGDVVSFIVAEGMKGIEAQEVQLDHHNPPTGMETRKQVGLPTHKPFGPTRGRRKA